MNNCLEIGEYKWAIKHTNFISEVAHFLPRSIKASLRKTTARTAALISEFSGTSATGTSGSRQLIIPKNDRFTMTKGAIQAANQAKKDQIIHVGQSRKIVMNSDRKKMQKEEEMEKQTKITAEAVNNSDCMDIDMAFSTNTTHS